MAPVDAALGAASKVGPYFSVTSFVPATIVTATTTVLVLAKPWSGDPNWELAFTSLSTPSLGQLGTLLVASMVVALALHPLQFGMVQLMEGYWGTSPIGLGLARVRITAHLRRLTSLERTQTRAAKRREQLEESGPGTPDAAAAHRWAEAEARRLASQYPFEREDVMPTMLGNALRRYEQMAGQPYELNIVSTAGHLLLVADPRDTAYVRDQRTQLDLAVRLCVSSAILTAIMVVLLAPTGWWLLLAAAPYVLALMFYRGACTVAREYGASLQTLVDLNRPQLYQRLRVPMPPTLNAERAQNRRVTAMLGSRTPQRMRLSKVEATPAGPDNQSRLRADE